MREPEVEGRGSARDVERPDTLWERGQMGCVGCCFGPVMSTPQLENWGRGYFARARTACRACESAPIGRACVTTRRREPLSRSSSHQHGNPRISCRPRTTAKPVLHRAGLQCIDLSSSAATDHLSDHSIGDGHRPGMQGRSLGRSSGAKTIGGSRPSDQSVYSRTVVDRRGLALRASVRHTDACHSHRTRNRQGAPPSWLMSDSQGRRW